MKIRFVIVTVLLAGVIGCGGCGINFGGFPTVGSKAPLSDNKILKAGLTGRDVCSYDPFIDASLHQTTIRSALEAHLPTVVMFGTPQHCTQCVEQIQTLTHLAEVYGGQVIFIHVDDYKDFKTVKQWVVKGEPWTGLIDRQGVIRFVFHGPTLDQEIRPKIDELLHT